MISLKEYQIGRLADWKKAAVDEPKGQTDLFAVLDSSSIDDENVRLERELELQKAVIAIKGRHGKNAVFRGADLLEGATTIERNSQIGGHRA